MLENPPPYTAPNKFPVTAKGFNMEETAEALARLVGNYVAELSRYFDLSQLDGVTIAWDYKQALLDLDRGFTTSHELAPSDEYVVGVAMTPSVLRGGKVKSHIILDAKYVSWLEDAQHKDFPLAFHLLAHECAHVEITHRFNTAFPSVLLQSAYPDAHDALRWKIIHLCWDEYAATRISAGFGKDPTEYYEDSFLRVLNETRPKANEFIKAYRIHGNTYQVIVEVYDVYGVLIKLAGYHLGNMAGQGLSIFDLPRTRTALKNHWFESYFERLNILCNNLMDDYGQWEDLSLFKSLGDLADELVAEGGVVLSRLDDGSFYVDIPFTRETIPE